MRAMAVGVSNTLCHSGNKIQLLRAPCCVCQGRGRVWCFGGYLLLQTGRQQHISALVHKVIGYKAKAYRERNPCTALRVSSCPSSLLCSTFSLLQGYGASVKPYCSFCLGSWRRLKHKILQQSPLLAQPSQFFHLLSPPS